MLEASTHTNINGEVNGKRYPYAFSQRTRWSSLLFAAAAAQYAQLVRPFYASDAKLYADAALKAYEFGSNSTNSLGLPSSMPERNAAKGSPYTIEWTESEEHIRPYLLLKSGCICSPRTKLISTACTNSPKSARSPMNGVLHARTIHPGSILQPHRGG